MDYANLTWVNMKEPLWVLERPIAEYLGYVIVNNNTAKFASHYALCESGPILLYEKRLSKITRKVGKFQAYHDVKLHYNLGKPQLSAIDYDFICNNLKKYEDDINGDSLVLRDQGFIYLFDHETKALEFILR